MEESPKAREIKWMIRDGKTDEARQFLKGTLNDELRDADVWVWAARLALTSQERQHALRKVFEHSENLELSNWALKELESLAEHEPSNLVSSPPSITSPQVAQSGSTKQKPALWLRLIRFGLAGFFLGLVGFYIISYLQERGLEMVDNGKYDMLPLLRVSVIFFYASAATSVAGALAVFAGIIITFVPRRD